MFSGYRKASDAASPETSPGGPTYPGTFEATISAPDTIGSERLQQQRDLHLFDSKSAAARAYSHAYDSQPSAIAVQMMGLANQRDQIERIVSRKDWPPFPGVELGHVPAFSRSPSTNPVTQPFGHLTHGAHLLGARDTVEAGRQGRKRFGQ